jgi:cyclomaltodextrinase / maltogenic alpha-amylase / neopullulanase
MAYKLSEANYRQLRAGRPFHMPPTAQPINATVTLRLEGISTQPEVVLTDTRRDYTWAITMHATDQANTWEAVVRLPSAITIVTYVFNAGDDTIMERRIVESKETQAGNRPVYGEWADVPYKIGIYDPDKMPADWTRGMVVYQIFPDRFARAQSAEEAASKMKGIYGHEPRLMNWDELPEDPPLGRDFFGGDLQGIISKLDYLKDLGVECIYLNPIFEASANHRYEAIDFKKIDQMLGTEADFDALIEAAHSRDIKVILDAVFNHCSSDSIYFDITGKFGNGATQSKESPYYRWFHFQQWPTEYDSWIGLGFMPEFAESPEMEHYFLGEGGITEYWLQKGIDGWRTDVPFDNTFVFWQRFRQRVDAVNPEAWTIAEDWRDATHYLLGDTFNATMNYRIAWAVRGFFALKYLTVSEFDDRLNTWLRDTPPPARHAQMNLLDSHDTDRLITACQGNRDRFKQAFAFIFAYVGAPTIFYGTETGIEGTYPENSRRAMPWDNLDEELHAFFKQIMNIRRDTPVLRYGDVQSIYIDDDNRIYGFVRRYKDEMIYVLFNASANDHIIVLEGAAGTWHDLLGFNPDVENKNDQLTIKLPAYGMGWYQQR